MAKPILFDTISRAKFETLDSDVKDKKNFLIKNTDGSLSKWIGNIENENNDFIVNFTFTSQTGGTMDKTIKEINDAYESGKTIICKGSFTPPGESSSFLIEQKIDLMIKVGNYKYRYPQFTIAVTENMSLTIHGKINATTGEENTFEMFAQVIPQSQA